jgi:hypothetical protein
MKYYVEQKSDFYFGLRLADLPFSQNSVMKFVCNSNLKASIPSLRSSKPFVKCTSYLKITTASPAVYILTVFGV